MAFYAVFNCFMSINNKKDEKEKPFDNLDGFVPVDKTDEDHLPFIN